VTPPLVLALVKYSLLALLWIFLLVAVRVIRSDLYGAAPRSPRPAPAAPTPAAAPSHAAAPRPVTATRLLVTEGPHAGTSVALAGQAVTLGRAPESSLVIADDYASNHHARLLPTAGGWVLEDLGSTNGTFLGRDRVTQPVTLGPGVPIRIGKTVLELRP
jgi:pSer/pThr/pTyr-binding forkhead associated (FHA) protein